MSRSMADSTVSIDPPRRRDSTTTTTIPNAAMSRLRAGKRQRSPGVPSGASLARTPSVAIWSQRPACLRG